MTNNADERKFLHRENVKVSAHLDALADLAGLKKRKRPFTPPAGLNLPADPRMSTTPVLQPPPAFSPQRPPSTDSADGFFGDFGEDAPAAKSAAAAPPLSSRGDDFLTADFAAGEKSGAIDFDPAAFPAPTLDPSQHDTNTFGLPVSQDTPANGSAAPQPPQGEAIDEVLDGFNW